jgi:hypothetical protein
MNRGDYNGTIAFEFDWAVSLRLELHLQGDKTMNMFPFFPSLFRSRTSCSIDIDIQNEDGK